MAIETNNCSLPRSYEQWNHVAFNLNRIGCGGIQNVAAPEDSKDNAHDCTYLGQYIHTIHRGHKMGVEVVTA